MYSEKFWTKAYGKEPPDLDPRLFERDALSLLRESMAKYKNKPALDFMGVSITYGELDDYSNRFASMLAANGFKKGDLVGINLPNIPEYVVALLGCLKVGCVTSGVSPLLSPQEMEHQLKDAKAKGLVTLDIIYAERVVNMAGRLPDLAMIVAANVGGFLPKIKQVLGKLLKKLPSAPVTPISGKTVYKFSDVLKSGKFTAAPPKVELGPDDNVFIMYTGGTTGLPKGAVLTHRNYVSEILTTCHFTDWDKSQGPVISAFPMFHIAGLTFYSISIYCGWTQLLLPDPRNTDYICQMMEKHRPWLICNVPSLYYLLMANPKFKTLDHSRIKCAVSAAAPFPADSQKELESIIGRATLVELYGMTETTAISVMNPPLGEKKLGTVGVPLPNTELKLVDPTTGEEAPVGEPGEIWVKNPMVMKEYFNNPEETKNTVTEDGYMRTGDVGVMDNDGYITLVDRTKDMIIVSGYKVFSKKVEDIMADHPAVEIMATIGTQNPDRPGSEMVKAYVVLSQGYEFDGDEEALKKDLLAFAKSKLAPYEVPKSFEIIKEMPLTSVGKLDKKQLRRWNQ